MLRFIRGEVGGTIVMYLDDRKEVQFVEGDGSLSERQALEYDMVACIGFDPLDPLCEYCNNRLECLGLDECPYPKEEDGRCSFWTILNCWDAAEGDAYPFIV